MLENISIKADVKVNADLTEATTEVVKGTRRGLGTLIKACIGSRIANKNAEAQRVEAQAAADEQLIRAGLARYENGKLVLLKDGANCARLLASYRNLRSVEFLSDCL